MEAPPAWTRSTSTSGEVIQEANAHAASGAAELAGMDQLQLPRTDLPPGMGASAKVPARSPAAPPSSFRLGRFQLYPTIEAAPPLDTDRNASSKAQLRLFAGAAVS